MNTTGTLRHACYDFNLKEKNIGIFIQDFVREGFGLFPLTFKERLYHKYEN